VPYVEAFARIETEIAEIHGRIKRTVNESEIRELQQQLNVAIERQGEAIRELNSHPEPTDMNVSFYEDHQRRLKAETTLIDALKSGTIKAHNGRNNPIDNVLWKGHPYFGYSIELSVIRVPITFEARRFLAARIDKPGFDVWLDTVLPLTESAERTLPHKEQCKRFLRKAIEAGPQQKPKEAYLLEAQAIVPGLSKRAFDAAWSEVVPDSWKDAGRRQWS
jgi:hypothetical protein